MRDILGPALVISALFLPCSAAAQVEVKPLARTNGVPILRLAASTRAAAMAGAYPIDGVDADVVFYNPALGVGAGVTTSYQRFGGESNLFSLATSAAGVMFGVRALDIALSPAAGELEGVAGYARTIKGLRLGVAAKWVRQVSGGQSKGIGALDAGVTASPIDWITLALAVQNIGGAFEINSTTYDLPRTFQLLATTDTKDLGPIDVMMTAHATSVRHEDLRGGIGVQASYWPFNGLKFYGRGGVRIGRSTLPAGVLSNGRESAGTAGAGITYRRTTFDYAWVPISGAPDSHRFGIRLN
ncbi:MAG: hypothetical protein ABIV28_02205 [Longimicrobiales bacterium]